MPGLSRGFAAPSWRWTGVVELLARHEWVYLDHCSRDPMGKG
jgi:hypothetical protein